VRGTHVLKKYFMYEVPVEEDEVFCVLDHMHSRYVSQNSKNFCYFSYTSSCIISDYTVW